MREAGKLAIEGKDYVVQDGDIMHFRFNVCPPQSPRSTNGGSRHAT